MKLSPVLFNSVLLCLALTAALSADSADATDTASDSATPAAKLEIQRAVYGAVGFGTVDVKTNLMALIQSGQTSIVANNDLVGYDPAPEQNKQLHIEYTLNGKSGSVTVGEGKTFTYSANATPPFAISLPVMKPPNTITADATDTASDSATSMAKLEIQQAVYGADGGDSGDVKAMLMALIQSGRKSIVANNDLLGYDPASGQGKQLHINYTLDGKSGTVTVDEGKTLTYSVNASPPFAIRSAKNPLNTIVAENYDAVSGEIKNEVCGEGGYNLCSIHDGNYIVYKDYDFDTGVAAFKARVASTNHCLIEVRLDDPAGPLIGSCPFEGTGGWQEWRDVICKVDNLQDGVRNICLVFRGDPRSVLVNLSWFVFLKSGGS
jgi:Carbohydrate binding module (family 6)